jgi:integrase
MGREPTHETTFTEASVKRYRPPPKPKKGTKGQQEDYFEKLMKGRTLVLRLSYGGTKAWRVGYYVNGRAQAKTLGHWLPEKKGMGVAAARAAAVSFDPKAASAASEAGSVKQVAEDWVKRYVAKKGLRSQREIERILNRYVYPAWERRKFFEIKRADVNELLDRLEDKHGAPQADCVLATLRSMMNWYATRNDKYSTPIVRGMQRDTREVSERNRARILNDDEIRAVWTGCGETGTFGALVQLLLLTAQRKDKVVNMRRADISDGVWTIATAKREKGNAGKLKLPQMALDIIAAQPVIDSNPFVLPGGRYRDSIPTFNSFSWRKRELDKQLPKKTPHWTLHDLRRTARSLMSRAGVSRDHSERVLGHAIPGVEGVYDRYDYAAEKAEALTKLASLIATIINPPDTTNVVDLKRGRR